MLALVFVALAACQAALASGNGGALPRVAVRRAAQASSIESGPGLNADYLADGCNSILLGAVFRTSFYNRSVPYAEFTSFLTTLCSLPANPQVDDGDSLYQLVLRPSHQSAFNLAASVLFGRWSPTSNSSTISSPSFFTSLAYRIVRDYHAAVCSNMKATTQQNDVGPGDVLKSSVIGSQVMGYYDACVDLASKGLAFIRLTRLGALPVQFSFVFTKSEGDSSAELGGTIYVPSPQGATPQCIYTTATGTPVKFESLGRSASLTAGTLYLMTCNIPRDQVNTGGSFLISTRSYMYVDVLIPGGVPLSYVSFLFNGYPLPPSPPKPSPPPSPPPSPKPPVPPSPPKPSCTYFLPPKCSGLYPMVELLVDKVAALQARTDNLEFTVTQTASALEVLFRAVVARGVFALGGEPTTLLAFMQQKVPVTSRTTGNDGSARWRDCHYSATLLQWSGPYLFTSRSIRIGDGGESGGTGNWAVMNFGTVRGKGDFEARCEDVFSVGGAGGCSAGGSAYGMSVALWGSATSSDCSMPQGWNLLYRLPAGPGDGAFNNARGRWFVPGGTVSPSANVDVYGKRASYDAMPIKFVCVTVSA